MNRTLMVFKENITYLYNIGISRTYKKTRGQKKYRHEFTVIQECAENWYEFWKLRQWQVKYSNCITSKNHGNYTYSCQINPGLETCLMRMCCNCWDFRQWDLTKSEVNIYLYLLNFRHINRSSWAAHIYEIQSEQ